MNGHTAVWAELRHVAKVLVLSFLVLSAVATPQLVLASDGKKPDKKEKQHGELDKITITGYRLNGSSSGFAGWLRLGGFYSPLQSTREFTPNRGETDADTPTCTKENSEPTTAGNPIVISTGNKVEYETDFTTSGEAPLTLQRTYNHYWNGVGLFGKHWVSSFDYKLSFGTMAVDGCHPRPGGGVCGIGSSSQIFAWRPDGRTIRYVRNAHDGVFYEDKPGAVSRIVRLADGGFVLYGEDDSTEQYSTAGYISTVRNQHGVGWTYGYSGTYPIHITHTSGRQVQLNWSAGRLVSVIDPGGNAYGYGYHVDALGAGLHRLGATVLPGHPQTTIEYHYEQPGRPGALTGKSFNGARYSTFTYDARGFATSSQHNGQELHRFNYTTKQAVV